jgi:integrase/recombinase XerD
MLKPFFCGFSAYCKGLNLADSSVNDAVRYIKQLNDFLNLQGLTAVRQITYKHLFNYTIKDYAGPAVIKARVWALTKFFAFLHLHEHIKDNIAKDLKAPKIPKNETSFLTENELKIIFTYLSKNLDKNNGQRDFLIILLMAVSGLRRAAVVGLNFEDFDSQNHRIFIAEKGCHSKRPIQIPFAVSGLLQDYILLRGIKSGPLFLNNRKKRLKAGGVNKIVNALKNRLLKDGHDFAHALHPHIFRHSAATQLNEAAGFTVTKEMLGHRNVQNTRKYIHLSPTSYGEYMKRHPYFDKAQQNCLKTEEI